MKILVTGAAGFIGGHLCSKLTQMGHEVVGIDNFFHPSKNPENSKVIFLDVRNCLPILNRFQPDIIYHLAAQIHVDYSIEHPAETIDINVNGTSILLDWVRHHPETKLVFASSSEIYGTAKTDSIPEYHPLNPQSPYAVTKLMGDKLCTVYKDLYGLKIDVIRNFNTFGPYQNDTSYGGVIAKFTKDALAGRPLQIYGDGTQQRDYMYIDDALQGYLLSLNTDLSQPMNFGSGTTVTINQLAELIKKITNSPSEIIHTVPRPGEVQKLQADITLAKSYGFKPTTDFERDLTRYISWRKNEIHDNRDGVHLSDSR